MVGNISVTSLMLILASVSMSALAQIVLKFGMSDSALQASIQSGGAFRILSQIVLSPFVLLGLTIYFLGAMVWLLVLSRIDVSQAYPFVGLGFILTMTLSMVMLGEVVTPLRIAGTLVVVCGVMMIAAT